MILLKRDRELYRLTLLRSSLGAQHAHERVPQTPDEHTRTAPSGSKFDNYPPTTNCVSTENWVSHNVIAITTK